jgi:phosphate transport system permease protein
MSERHSDRSRWSSPEMQARLRRRRAAERRLGRLGAAAIGVAGLSLGLLLASIGWSGRTAFLQTQIRLDLSFDPEVLGISATDGPHFHESVAGADTQALVREALRALFPEVQGRSELRSLLSLVSGGARGALRERLLADPSLLGRSVPVWLPADDEVDMLAKGNVDADLPESDRRLSDAQLAWIRALEAQGRLRTVWSAAFLTNGDSREPEQAGVLGAVVGSLLTLAATLLLAFPLGVSAAVYLEEFAPRNRWTDLIEVNINNLAAVPSIVFGLLGLAVFLNALHLPRSAPLVGGMTLALMTLPTIIIAGRAAIQAVPPSIREAARGIGASPLQVVAHHVLPLALPGILTGTIIGMARALGETAPLLMVGMVAFIVDIPRSLTDAATVLPVQVFLWADSPERAFLEKTSAATLVLLTFLIGMNGAAIWLRQRTERRW